MKQWQKIAGIIVGAIIILFLAVCYLLIFRPQIFMGPDPGATYKAKGLYGNVSDLFFVNENTGIALSSLTYPEKPDSVIVFRTTDAGHNWRPILELPEYDHAFNAIKIGSCVFCAIKKNSIFSLLCVDVLSGNHTLSNDKLSSLPILFQYDNKLGYTANGVFYTTDNEFEATDSIGNYDKRPSNKGIAVIGNHIYGFIFDKDSCVNKLYDFTDRTIIDNFFTHGDASLIRASDNSCLILTRNEKAVIMYEFDCIKGTILQRAIYDAQMLQPLKMENGIIYTLVSDGPFADNHLLLGDKSWQTNINVCLNESNITAYSLYENYFFYYYSLHHIVKIYINSHKL